jgi:tetratricopeptide (TPR) repeat protein
MSNPIQVFESPNILLLLQEIDFTSAGELAVRTLDSHLKQPSSNTRISFRQLSIHGAAKQWLTKYQPESHSPLDRVFGYTEALHHICKLKLWDVVVLILMIPLDVSNSARDYSLPFYEYLICKGLSRKLLEITQDIIAAFKDTHIDTSFVILLQARAMAGINKHKEAIEVLKSLRSQVVFESLIYLETLACLGICQIFMGIYKEGIVSLQVCLSMIENSSELRLHKRAIELKTDILECLGFCAMIHNEFKQAMKLYAEVIRIREDLKILHKLIYPLGHQGILLRRTGNYDGSIISLTGAKQIAEASQDQEAVAWINHHLAWVYLNQSNLRLAEQYGKIALVEYQKLENHRGIADCYQQIGRVYLARGNQWLDEAEQSFEKALLLRNAIHNNHGAASSVTDLSFVLWHRRLYFQAMRCFAQSLYMYFQMQILIPSRLFRSIRLFWVWTIGRRNWTT